MIGFLNNIKNSLVNFTGFIFRKKFRFYWILAVIAVVVIWFFFFRNQSKVETITVHPAEFLQQVSVSGNLVATQDLDLSFQQTGVVQKVYVRVGDKVKTGQILATQDISQLYAQYQEMQAGIDVQKAKLAQLLAGASSEDVKISEDTVALAQQNLDNAYQNELINLGDAYTSIYNAYNTVVVLINNYSGYFNSVDQQSIIVQNNKVVIQNKMASAKINLDSARISGIGPATDIYIAAIKSDLSSVYDSLGLIRSQLDQGMYYYNISSTDKASLDTQKTNISSILSKVALSEQNIASYKLSLQQAQSQLNLKKAPPRLTDVAVYQAQIKQAEASLANVGAQIRKQQIYSPIDGLVSMFDAKIGNVFSANQAAASVISEDPLEIESYIPEIYIPMIKVGDLAQVTLDAYGSDIFFEAQVVSIDPSETLKDGVSSYKTKLQLKSNDEKLRSGMSANVLITTERKENVISVPQRVVEIKEGKRFVRVQIGEKIIEKEVQTGMVSSLGKVEIISGLNDGDVVVLSQ